MVESYCCDRKYYCIFSEWRNDYVEYLNGNCKKGKRGLYKDPDGKERLDYYERLAIFLNERENSLFDEEKRFSYEAKNFGKEKGTLILVKSKEDKLFYLQSDQFGFSAPNSKGKHIYDIYLELSKNADKKENVARWIWESRTIGGSFLWPLEEGMNRNPDYNKARGQGHVQDRCDLTLREIQGCYDDERIIGKMNSENKINCLYDKINNSPKKYENMKIWLKHFGKFNTYVEYFCLDSFVEHIDNEKIRPINLYEPEKKFDGNYEAKYIYGRCSKNTNCNMLCNMLNRICSLIVERSDRMERIISNYEENKKIIATGLKC